MAPLLQRRFVIRCADEIVRSKPIALFRVQPETALFFNTVFLPVVPESNESGTKFYKHLYLLT
jgi:hypothetical protein